MPGIIKRIFSSLWVLVPACVILLTMALYPIGRALICPPYPYQLDYAEGFLAVESQMMARGESIYPTLEDYPYLVGNYPPVYPALCAPFFLLFGPSLLWGRLICVLSAVGIAICMVVIIYNRTKGILPRGEVLPIVLAPLLFWNTYALYEWIGYARVDLPAIFFGLIGLAMLSGEINKPRLRMAILFFLLSIFTKQIQVFAPLSAMIFLFLKERKTGLYFLKWFLGLFLVIFIFLILATRGQYFLHTVTYNANVFELWQLKVWIGHLFRLYPFYLLAFLLLGGVVIYDYLSKRGTGKTSPPDLFSIYAIVGGLSFLTIGKVGAASNYLLEFHVALSIFTCIKIAALVQYPRETRTKTKAMVLIILVGALLNLHAIHVVRARRMLFSRPNPGKGSFEKGNKMLEIISEYPDPILCEQPIFLLLAGKKVLFQPFIMSQLHKEGKWDQTPVMEDIRQKSFSLIMTGQDVTGEGHFWQYTPEMVGAIRDHYTPLLSGRPLTRNFLESPLGGIPYFIYIPEREDHD